MAIYLITGKLGAGKTLLAVERIRMALVSGRPVATNLDLSLENLVGRRARKVRVFRIPDKPTVGDLDAIGLGNPTYNEDQNGLIVLDELATWLNARSFQDAGRKEVIDWLVHSRKRGWDVIFIAQHLSQVDKQVREALVEYHVPVRRLDRLQIPFVSFLIKGLTLGFFELRLPRIHIAAVKYGSDADAIVADRWMARGTSLYDGYDTRQIFRSDYPHSTYMYLTPWHVVGRYEGVSSWWRRLVGGGQRAKPAAAKAISDEKRRLVRLLQALPADQRVYHWQRLQRLGVL